MVQTNGSDVAQKPGPTLSRAHFGNSASSMRGVRDNSLDVITEENEVLLTQLPETAYSAPPRRRQVRAIQILFFLLWLWVRSLRPVAWVGSANPTPSNIHPCRVGPTLNHKTLTGVVILNPISNLSSWAWSLLQGIFFFYKRILTVILRLVTCFILCTPSFSSRGWVCIINEKLYICILLFLRKHFNKIHWPIQDQRWSYSLLAHN
jgi:hypothetical protein